MKDGTRHVVGRKISEVVVGQNSADRMQYVFLVFSDGTYFEFYGRDFTCAGGVDHGDVRDAAKYLERTGATIGDIYR